MSESLLEASSLAEMALGKAGGLGTGSKQLWTGALGLGCGGPCLELGSRDAGTDDVLSAWSWDAWVAQRLSICLGLGA